MRTASTRRRCDWRAGSRRGSSCGARTSRRGWRMLRRRSWGCSGARTAVRRSSRSQTEPPGRTTPSNTVLLGSVRPLATELWDAYARELVEDGLRWSDAEGDVDEDACHARAAAALDSARLVDELAHALITGPSEAEPLR